MTMPKAYDPEQGYMYQILLWDKFNREYDHLDYAVDKADKDFLMKEYRLAYSSDHSFKVIPLPRKYWKPVEVIIPAKTSTIKKITITRGEGRRTECGIPHYATSWSQANAILQDMAYTAPKEGKGYDKTDFVVEFNEKDKNGEDIIYSGRYDLKRNDTVYGDLYRHIKNFCEFYADMMPNGRPSHIKTEEQYQEIIKNNKAEYAGFLTDVLYPSKELLS